MDYITIAYIIGPFGNKGEVKIKIATDFPEKRFCSGKKICILDTHKNLIEKEIEKTWWHKKNIILKLSDCDSISQAEQFSQREIVIKENELHELPENTYYIKNIIGLKVYNEKGIYLGKVTDCFETGSNDVYVVTNGSSEILVPAIKQVVKKIDIEKQEMFIESLEEWD